MSATARVICYSIAAAGSAGIGIIMSASVMDAKTWAIAIGSAIMAGCSAAVAYADKGPKS